MPKKRTRRSRNTPLASPEDIQFETGEQVTIRGYIGGSGREIELTREIVSNIGYLVKDKEGRESFLPAKDIINWKGKVTVEQAEARR